MSANAQGANVSICQHWAQNGSCLTKTLNRLRWENKSAKSMNKKRSGTFGVKTRSYLWSQFI